MQLAIITAFLGAVSANIIFNHVPLTCNEEHSGVNSIDGLTGCLPGQLCLVSGTCAAAEYVRRDTAPRSDGRCGTQFANATCDPNGAYGGCCSYYGYCGDTTDYCGAGCQSGCDNLAPTSTAASGSAPSSTPRADGRCGSAYGGATCDPNGAYGGCCSKYGFCGNTTAHCEVSQGCQSGCVDSPPTTTKPPGNPATDNPATQTLTGEGVITQKTAPTPSSTGAVTTDGSCGAQYNDTICGNWPQGSCCSMYGFCGNTSAHCGDGCQSGPCNQAPLPPAPGPSAAPANANGGSLTVIGKTGVPAMHAGLMPNGKVIFLDKVENYTQLNLTDGQYAYSSEWDPETNELVGLQYKTNAFCSGGAFLPDGRWLSLGGNAPLTFIDPTVGDGFDAIRYLSRSSSDASLDGQAWSEPGNKLSSARWYASAQTMPDGSIFVASGSLNGLDPTKPENNNPTWELLNNLGVSSGAAINMTILAANQPYYMYPFLHLMKDGNLFVFVSRSSESFDVNTNTTVATYPELPGYYRTYPNTGGSVLMPLSSENNWEPDIIICGGGAYQDITSPTEASCGRIRPLDTTPQWEMDSMPEGRGMVEGTLLPDGTIIWVNGCNSGAQGFGLAKDPTYEVLIYDPTQALGKRWSTGPTSTIARLYHSVALLLLDGTLIIAGSNPVQMPVLTPVPNQVPSEDYVTEFRIERYVPPYLSGDNANKRPTNVTLSSKALKNGGTFTVSFTAPAGNKQVKVALYHGGYVTHNLHMNHRMLFLDNSGFNAGQTSQTLSVTMPPNANVAPPGPYVVYVTVDGVPAYGQFVSVS